MSEQVDLIAHTFAPLRVEETAAGLSVLGGTFHFHFAEGNGLINVIEVEGREWLARRPVPDLWCSAAVDPREGRWEAARETEAELEVRERRPERVVVVARGTYRDRDGSPAPVQYQLTYTIDCDGVVLVEVENAGTGPGALRWLTFSGASVKRSQVEFYSFIGDLAETEDTGGWVTRLLPADGEAKTLHTTRILPWMQLGNDTSGLDLTMDYAEELDHGWTDSMPKADPLDRVGGNFVLECDRTRVSWTYYAIRNLFTPVRPDWRRYNRFHLSVVPAKAYHPELADLRVHWLGPHQWKADPFRYPSDEEIAELARRGINVIVGGAHWRSGDYEHPDDPAEIRRVIAACHRVGIRIIPYITFTDLEHDTPAFPEHGQEWQIEPVAEFRHQTNLMCYGAEGWQEHWKRDVDTILDRFDFDGLYIDFWVGKMACRNLLHGCGHKYPRFTLPGVREMAWHAYRRVKARGEDQFILANTNLFAGALINNLVDIRLPGEWANIEETPEELVRGHLNSRRLGCNSLLLRRREVSLRSVSFSLRCQGTMVMQHGPAAGEPQELLMRYADLLRFFGVSRAQTQSAWGQAADATWDQPGGTVYWSRGDRGTLLILANLAAARTQGTLQVAKPAALGLQARTRYLAYRPDRNELAVPEPAVGAELRAFELSLKPYEPALLFLTAYAGRPQVLWASNSDGVAEEEFDSRADRLAFSVEGAPGATSRVTLYAGEARATTALQGQDKLRMQRRGALVMVEVRCNEAVHVTFGPG